MPHLAFKQFSGLSCGAACLLVAAKELGVQRFPDEQAFGLLRNQEVELSNACERGLYRITANGREAYSMPDGIARAAQLLGMEVAVFGKGRVVPRILERKYPNVRIALANLGVGMVQGVPKLAENERMLVAVGVGLLGLHWVLYRPDRTYMDPAYGKTTTSSLWGMAQLGVLRYWDTGISVVVRYGDVV